MCQPVIRIVWFFFVNHHSSSFNPLVIHCNFYCYKLTFCWTLKHIFKWWTLTKLIAKQSPIYEYRNCNVIPNKQIVVKSIILSLMYLTIPKILFLGILQNRLLRIGHIVFEFVYINCQFFLIWNKQITNDEEYKFCTVFEYGIYLRIIYNNEKTKKNYS